MSIATKWKAFQAMRLMDNGWQLIFNRLFFPSESLQLCRYRGLEFITDLDGGDATGAREVLTSDEYAGYLPLVVSGRPLNVLDLGSNNGGFPLLLAANGFEIGKLVAAELNPSTFRRLRFNIERNIQGQVFLLNTAVSGDGRPVRIADSKGSTSDSIYGEDGPGPGSRDIAGATLDEIIEAAFGNERIDVCKVDIEGAEFEVFLGGNCSKISQADLLLIEIHHGPGKEREVIRERLLEKGFEEIEGEDKTGDLHYVHVFRYSGAV